MIRQFLPTKDASVYSEFPTRNTGIDEIIEIGKTDDGADSIRSIIAFDFATVRSLLGSGGECILRLQTALAQRIQLNQQIDVCTYTGSWVEGSGYFYQDLYQIPNGVVWTDLSASFSPTSSFTTPEPWTDLQLDVTSLVMTGSATGLILQFPSASESDINNKGIIKIFSKNTHTIYAPILEVRWTDQVYSTGSLSSSVNKNLHVFPHSLQTTYSPNELVTVDLTVREKYPLKTFSNYLNPFASNLYLPSSSYFSVVDDATGFAVIPFSPYTAIHQGPSGSYCQFRLDNMSPRRFYRLVFKIVQSGNEKVIDNNFIFSVK
jgi:hypothetical protein